MNRPLVYLDNAATTFPKPASVRAGVAKCLAEYCGNPGRGGSPISLAAAEKVYECREELADFFGVSSPSRVVFTSGCTAALNLALKGLLRRGDHVLVSDFEHNAVRRPLERLRAEGRIDFSRFSLRDVSETSLCALLCPQTRMLVCTAASNVCSLTAPLAFLGDFCTRHGLLFVVDGAQGGGHLGIFADRMHVSALALPAHKGLYGIPGAGALILGEGILPEPLTEGGSGSLSLDPGMPAEPPERYEAGTLPLPAIVSMLDGTRFVRALGVDRVAELERGWFFRLRERLENVSGCTVYLPEVPGPVLSFNLRGRSADVVANALASRGICVRGGFHCAPWAHEALGTDRPDADGFCPGGTVRVSFSVFTRERDLDALYEALCD